MLPKILSRRAGLLAAAALALAAGACQPQPKAGETLRIYNWADYIDPALIKAFEAETGVKVVYDTFDSQEIVETKLLTGGTGYDVVSVANNKLPRLIAARTVRPLDKARLPGLSDFRPELMSRLARFDPGAAHASPYMWGSIGIGYNVEAVKKRLPGVAIDSWAVVFEPQNLARLADCGVTFLDASEDMFSVTLAYMGRDPNSTAPADYAAAADKLLKVRPSVRKFTSSEYLNGLASGDVCVAVGYSGDILQARQRAAEAGQGEVAYVLAKEGTQVFFDTFVIPADAPHPEAAHKFLAFLQRPEIIARASNYTQFANASLAATPQVDAEVRNNPNIYPTPQVLARTFVSTGKDPATARAINRQWTRVVTGR